MTTLRESLKAEIETAKEEVAKLEARFALLETGLGGILEHDIDAVKTWFSAIDEHFEHLWRKS